MLPLCLLQELSHAVHTQHEAEMEVKAVQRRCEELKAALLRCMKARLLTFPLLHVCSCICCRVLCEPHARTVVSFLAASLSSMCIPHHLQWRIYSGIRLQCAKGLPIALLASCTGDKLARHIHGQLSFP